jgi:hypothetical protein
VDEVHLGQRFGGHLMSPFFSQCRGRGFESLHLHPKRAGQPRFTPWLSRARSNFVRDPCANEMT